MRYLLPIVLCLYYSSCVHADASASIGEPLRDAIDRLSADELNIVSTTLTLPPRILVVAVPPEHGSNLARINWLLEHHGYELVMLDATNGYVIKSPDSALPIPAINPPARRQNDQFIEEVVVYAKYQLGRNIHHANALDKHDLETIPSLGRDTLRSLHLLPGVASSGISARQRFRGGDSDEVLYVLEGVELIAPFHFQGFHDLFTAINPNIIEAGEVYMSGYPSEYGAKMSGVVDLSLLQPEQPIEGTIDLNLYSISADARGLRGDWSWLVSARQSVLDLGLQSVERDYGNPKFHDELLRVIWDSSVGEHEWGLLNTQDHLRLADGREQGTTTVQHRAAWWRWNYSLNERLASTLSINWMATDTQRRGTYQQPLVPTSTLGERRDFDIYRVKNVWNWQVSDQWTWLTGWSFSRHKGKFVADLSASYPSYFEPIQRVSSRSRAVSVSRSGETWSIFTSSTHEFDDLSLTVGLRLDGQDIDPVHVQQLSLRGSFNYSLTDNLDLFVDVGRYTQQQQLHEIQIDDGKLELDPPQHSDQVNLGLLWTRGNWQLRGEGYLRDIRDPWSRADNLYNRWVLLPELQGDRYLISARRAKASGTELSVNWTPTGELNVGLSYAHSLTRELINDRWHRRPWNQSHTWRLGLSWQSAQWSLAAHTTYRDGWPVTPFVEVSTQLPAAINTRKLPHYLSIDLHVSRRIQFGWGDMRVYLDVSNASDRENVGGYDFVGSFVRKEQNLLPIAPSLGVTLSW